MACRSQSGRDKAEEGCYGNSVKQCITSESIRYAEVDDALKNIRVQLMFCSKQLNDDEETTERECNEGVDERAVKTNTANGRRAHSTEENQLPFVI